MIPQPGWYNYVQCNSLLYNLHSNEKPVAWLCFSQSYQWDLNQRNSWEFCPCLFTCFQSSVGFKRALKCFAHWADLTGVESVKWKIKCTLLTAVISGHRLLSSQRTLNVTLKGICHQKDTVNPFHFHVSQWQGTKNKRTGVLWYA